MKAPPLLPEETLLRVLRRAHLDGLSVLMVAAFFAALSAVNGDLFGACVGLAVAAAGAVELHGASLLRAGEPRGMNWLIASQPYLFATVQAYCAIQLSSYDPTLMRAAMTSDLRAQIAATGLSEDQFLHLAYSLIYWIFAVATVFYQGGMTIYYWRRREAVRAALQSED